ncbi:hypothetical protein JQK87_10620 [Streptomyces sp. G44]|uniref:hypothetical protein n=1 Tax=Streptomyces sp. G44 TaxID=2807632 RepID=UPI0019611949|nr:hypothetical protein [Streptomyces sp. G44]MBM7168860.1 hypothetical protein [Streptomyces sp. G44]
MKSERDLPELPLKRQGLSDRDYERMASAEAHLVRKCMRSFGFADFPLHPGLGAPMSEHVTMTAVAVSPYGLFDGGQARRWGYGFAPHRGEAWGTGAEPKGRVPTRREDQVLHGFGAGSGGKAVVRGREVPEGGCAAEGARRLTEGVSDQDRLSEYVSRRSQEIDRAVAKDERVRRAFRDWSRCVEGKGFKEYESPVAAFHDKAWRAGREDGNTARTKQELGTAVADVACKRKLNTVGVWWAVADEKQRADIRGHKAEYAAAREDRDRVRATIREVLGEK